MASADCIFRFGFEFGRCKMHQCPKQSRWKIERHGVYGVISGLVEHRCKYTLVNKRKRLYRYRVEDYFRVPRYSMVQQIQTIVWQEVHLFSPRNEKHLTQSASAPNDRCRESPTIPYLMRSSSTGRKPIVLYNRSSMNSQDSLICSPRDKEEVLRLQV